MKKKIREKRLAINMILLVILIALSSAVLFNSRGLYLWASRMKAGVPRSLALAVIEPIQWFSHLTQLDVPIMSLHALFQKASGIETDEGWQSEAPESSGEAEAASAESVSVPIDPSLEKQNREYSASNPLRVLFIGDSMIEGPIYVMFTRSVFNDDSIEYRIKSRHSSGLTRPDYYNWPREAESILSKDKYDCVVVLLGTNDAQDMFVGNKTYFFNSKEWLANYEARAVSFISFLNGSVPEVYWIGLPRMKRADFDSWIMILNSIYERVCSRFTRVRFIPTATLLSDSKGNYADYLKTGNRIEFFRAQDGIHLLYPAGKIISDVLIDDIRKDFKFEE